MGGSSNDGPGSSRGYGSSLRDELAMQLQRQQQEPASNGVQSLSPAQMQQMRELQEMQQQQRQQQVQQQQMQQAQLQQIQQQQTMQQHHQQSNATPVVAPPRQQGQQAQQQGVNPELQPMTSQQAITQVVRYARVRRHTAQSYVENAHVHIPKAFSQVPRKVGP